MLRFLASVSVLAMLAVSATVAPGCSSPAPLGGQGASCATPDDCQANLACVTQANGNRICSSDLGPIVHTEEGGMPGDSAAPLMDGAPASDTGTTAVDSGTPVKDTGSPADTGSSGG